MEIAVAQMMEHIFKALFPIVLIIITISFSLRIIKQIFQSDCCLEAPLKLKWAIEGGFRKDLSLNEDVICDAWELVQVKPTQETLVNSTITDDILHIKFIYICQSRRAAEKFYWSKARYELGLVLNQDTTI